MASKQEDYSNYPLAIALTQHYCQTATKKHLKNRIQVQAKYIGNDIVFPYSNIQNLEEFYAQVLKLLIQLKSMSLVRCPSSSLETNDTCTIIQQ